VNRRIEHKKIEVDEISRYPQKKIVRLLRTGCCALLAFLLKLRGMVLDLISR